MFCERCAQGPDRFHRRPPGRQDRSIRVAAQQLHRAQQSRANGAWYIFDPTRLAPQTGLIRIGTGHDAADTSFATIFGPATFASMKVTMELLDGPAPTYTTDAISTSS